MGDTIELALEGGINYYIHNNTVRCEMPGIPFFWLGCPSIEDDEFVPYEYENLNAALVTVIEHYRRNYDPTTR